MSKFDTPNFWWHIPVEIVHLVKRVCYRVTSASGNQHWRQTDRRPGRRLRGPWCCPWCWKSSAWTERMRNKSYFSKVLLATIRDFGIILSLSNLQFRSSLFCSWVGAALASVVAWKLLLAIYTEPAPCCSRFTQTSSLSSPQTFFCKDWVRWVSRSIILNIHATPRNSSTRVKL